MAARARVEEEARRLAGARRHHDDARPHVAVLAGGGVHVGDAGREALGVRRHLPGHGPGHDPEPPGGERRGQQDGRRREVGVGRAAAAALAAVVAGRPVAERPREDREARGDDGDAEALAGLLDRELVAARLRGRHEDAVRLVLDPLVRAEDPDHLVEAVVIGLEVLVADRPVVAEAVAAAALEVPGAEAERDATPVVRAAAEHAAAEPHEAGARGDGVGLALDVPAALAGVELAEGPPAVALAAPGRVVVPGEHRPVLARVPGLPGLEHHDLGPGLGEDLRRHPAAGPRPHDAHVPRLRRRQDLHDAKLSPPRAWGVNRRLWGRAGVGRGGVGREASGAGRLRRACVRRGVVTEWRQRTDYPVASRAP